MQNNLGFEFAHAIYSGQFSELEEVEREEKKQSIEAYDRRSSVRIAIKEDDHDNREPDEGITD